ncbi:MAG: LacI family DNA-binding transcriptional regulator [Lacrimispora sp.]|uniref:LacI family DNA-binding transcriptional regulator n=1 Tax=Lacrimispora sp. TaxID=2719234 RepID=UPI0039E3C6F6
MVTIAEVAKEAGVSVATVSRVINKNGPISPKSLEKVNAAIEALNYQPNVWGRRLRRKESRMLLIFVPNIGNPYYASIVSGIEDTARNADYGTMLCITNQEKIREREFTELLYNGQADGAVFLYSDKNSKEIRKLSSEVPVVQCCEFSRDSRDGHVSIDNFKAAKEAAEYLISLGHERIGFVGSDNQFISSEYRQKGFEAGLAQAGIVPDERYFAYGDRDYSFESGIHAGKELLSLQEKERPTAVFCVSDVLALGVIRAAGNMGLRVPEDISVIGFDDVEYATMFDPMLTTISQPRYSLGKASVEMLLSQIETGETGEAVYLEHRLILRDSTVKNRKE